MSLSTGVTNSAHNTVSRAAAAAISDIRSSRGAIIARAVHGPGGTIADEITQPTTDGYTAMPFLFGDNLGETALFWWEY